MPDSNYSLADLSAVMGKDGMFGGNGASWIVMLLIFFLFFRNGGNWGGFGADSGLVGTPAATQDSVRNVLSNIETSKILDAIQGNSAAISQLSQSTGIGFEQMQNALCGVKTAIIETANATNLSVKDVQNAIVMGNAQVISTLQTACSQLGVQMLNGFNAQNIQMLTGFNQTDKTLCDIKSTVAADFAALQYQNERNFNSLVQAGNENTDKILQAFATDRFNTLQTELALARAEISQKDQTAAIVAQLKGSCGCGCNSGCGCNC